MIEDDYKKSIQSELAYLSERIDELILIEDRADKKSNNFVEIIKVADDERKKSLDALTKQLQGIHETFNKINKCSESINRYVIFAKKMANATVQTFMGVMLVIVIALLVVFFWLRHESNKLDDAKAALATISIPLKQKPTILSVKGKEYVRIIPDSDSILSHEGQDRDGIYAEVWHYGDD